MTKPTKTAKTSAPIEADEPTKTGKAPRPASSYDEPTPEKIAFGNRMREAREISGMSQAEAAEAMGYSQAVQLSQMESGNRMPTLRVLVHCATLYGTTMDFLCGFVQDSDRDPVAALQRHLGAMLQAQVQRLVNGMAVSSAEVMREVLPNIAESTRLANVAIEASTALQSFRALNPKFDNMRGGATLATKVELALVIANQHMANVARAKRITTVKTMREAHANAAGVEGQMSLQPALDLI